MMRRPAPASCSGQAGYTGGDARPDRHGPAAGRSIGSERGAVRLRASDVATLADALGFLDSRVNLERTLSGAGAARAYRLDRMQALLEALGRPQRDVRCVHIAGSKGKGSTAEMTAACLSGCGYAVGLYTSPHLVDVRERIRINQEKIGESAFARLCREVGLAAERIERRHGPATYFEILTAMGLLYFREQAVDIAVIEVGLGGRLDATNLVQPEVCAITAIQLEHTHILGDTLDKIAREKAGILKRGVPAVTVPQAPEAMEAIREVAAGVGAPLAVLGEDIEYTARFEAAPGLGFHARVCVTTPRSTFEHIPVPLRGEHQAVNCGLALAIVDCLRERGLQASEGRVAEGLARTPSHGRLEVVPGIPRIVLDGAHTPDSIAALVRATGAHLRYDSMVVVFGCATDKDVRGMLARIAAGADKIIFTRAAGSPRAADPRDLQRRFAEVSSKMALTAGTLEEALRLALAAVDKDDLIVITGSFYLAGEARGLLQRMGRIAPG